MKESNRDALAKMDNHELASELCDNVFLSCTNCPGLDICEPELGHANGLEKWLNIETEGGWILWNG